MKKYNYIDLNGVFVWIILPILLFLFSMNGVYAYFTATASEQRATTTTATINLAIENDSQTTVNNHTTVLSGNVLPGDTVYFVGDVVNTGSIDFYCVIEYIVKSVSKTGKTNVINHSYHTATGVELVVIGTHFNTAATEIKKDGSATFSLSCKIPTDYELSQYGGGKVLMTVTAFAIQTTHLNQEDTIDDAVEATNMLLPVMNLPSAYQELEYIESTGTQYIDTGFIPNNNTKVYAEFQSTDITKANFMFGARTTDATNAFYISNDVAAFYPRFGAQPNTNTGISDTNKHTLTMDVNGTYFDNVLKITGGAQTFTCPGNFYIGSVNQAGTVRAGYVKIYSLKLWDNDTPVRDYVPCYRKCDNVAGLYDTVNDVFYTSAIDLFERGDVIEESFENYQELEYIESTGTQYIDTGVLPAYNLNYKLTFTPEYENKQGDGGNAAFFGSTTTSTDGTKDYAFQLNFGGSIDQKQIYTWREFRNAGASYKIAEYVNTNNMPSRINTIELRSDRKFYANGATTSSSGGQVDATSAYTFTDTIAVFGRNLHGVIQPFSYFSLKVYGLQMWLDDTLIRDFVPCYSKIDGAKGLFDKVNNVFYPNLGGGEDFLGQGDYKIYGNSVQSILPSDYQQVEYIQNGGNQYIDTGVLASENNSFEVKAQLVHTDTTSQTIWGGRNSANSGVLQGNQLSCVKSSGKYQFICGHTAYATYESDLNTHLFYAYKNELYIDNNLIYTATVNAITSENNVYLFATNTAGQVGFNGGSLKMYYCKIWNNDKLIRDFIPCYRKSDNVAGLYDLVEQKFYTNAGSDTFQVGSNAPTQNAPVKVMSTGDLTKNLFDISKAENGSLLTASGLNYDITNRCRAGFTYLEAGDYTVSINNGIKTGGYIHKYTSADASTWLGSNTITVSTSGDLNIGKFNLERPCYVRFVIMPASNSITNLTIEMLATCEVQLEKGSTATAYEPYGKYKVSITASSKNLFDATKIANTSFEVSADGSTITMPLNTTSNHDGGKSTSTKLSTLCPSLKVGDEVILSFTSTGHQNLIYLSSGVNWTNRTSRIITQADLDANVVLYANDTRSNYNETEQVIITNFQIEYGTTVTTYVPFAETITHTFYLDEPLRRIGSVADYIDLTTGTVVRRVRHLELAIADMNSSEDYPGWKNIGEFINSDYPSLNDVFGRKTQLICNISNNLECVGINTIGANQTLWLRKEVFGLTKTQWIEQYPDLVVEIDYVLQTAVEEEIALPDWSIAEYSIIEVDTEIAPSRIIVGI